MACQVLKIENSKIQPCNSVIIKDLWYEDNLWCAFRVDDCSHFTHGKALVSNYDEHYKDEKFEMDLNNTEFVLFLGTKRFVECMDAQTKDTGAISIYSSLNKNLVQTEKTEIGCDTARFSFGNENTFDAFSICTGADGTIGNVYLYKDKASQSPLGLFFFGCVDGDMVSAQEMIDSFKAAFGMERVKTRSLKNKIDGAEKKNKDNGNQDNIPADKDRNIK